jgi:hypothetical protein
MRQIAKTLTLLSAAALLTGCVAGNVPDSPASIPEFETEQTARDIVPDEAALRDIQAGSTRFVGDVEEYSLYLARGADRSLCLIQIRDDTWESTGCGAGNDVGTQLRSGTRIEAGSFTFPDDDLRGRERHQLSESVTVISAR